MSDSTPIEEEVADQLLNLDNQVCFAVYSAARRIVRSYRPLLDELGLTYPQYLVMLALWGAHSERQPPPCVRDLGERLELDSGTLTPLLKRLEAKQLLRRERDRTDERELRVRLTPAGRRLKLQAAKLPLALLAQSPLAPEELFQLRDTLNRMRPSDASD